MMRFGVASACVGVGPDSGSPCPRLHACAAGEDAIWVAVHVACLRLWCRRYDPHSVPVYDGPGPGARRSALGLV